ncbi:hypothetical protein ACHAWF_013336 [Thalassiosira exigua]
MSGNRALKKLLVVIAVAIAISVQFRAAELLHQSRRWGAVDKDDKSDGPPNLTVGLAAAGPPEEVDTKGQGVDAPNDPGKQLVRSDSDEVRAQPVVQPAAGQDANEAKVAQIPVATAAKVKEKGADVRSRSDGGTLSPQRPGDELPERSQVSPSQRAPRVVAIEGRSLVTSSATAPVDFKETSMPTEGPRVEPNWYDPIAGDFVEGYDLDACIPMYDWQLQSFPSCNDFHELDLTKMRLFGMGGSRFAFELTQELDGRQIVYKTIQYKKDLTMERVEKQRRDAIAMERTTKSQFIPDAHGYCGLGVMMDFMPEGNFQAYMKGARLAGGSTLPPVDKLRIAIHIATSVADLHTIDDTPIPSLFHNDICCHQFLFQNGVFKLNDFNMARPIYIDKNTKEGCTQSRFHMSMWKGRSLEDMQRKLAKESISMHPDKMDVWMMGNLIYYALTDLYIFEKPRNLSWQESVGELLAGRRSPYPEDIDKSEDPSYIAMKKALDMCWTQDWRERSSARSISDYLWQQLRDVTGEKDPDVRVTLPERDPNQRYTDSDYLKYNS